MTWRELEQVLLGARAVAPGPAQTPLQLAVQLAFDDDFEVIELDEMNQPDIDAAIRYFSRHRQWPQISDDESTLLWFRLDYALEYVGCFVGAVDYPLLGISEPTLAEEDLIEWALCRLWAQCGRQRMIEEMSLIRSAYDTPHEPPAEGKNFS